jgi:hypothetical protein
MLKDATMYILSVGLAFYGGMKLNQLKRLDTVKIGKLIIEFQDKPTCPSVPVIKPIKKPAVEPTFVPEPPAEDFKKVLKLEKEEEDEPILKDPLMVEQTIESCYDSAEKLQGDYYYYAKKISECKYEELIFQNCYYEDNWEELLNCKNNANDQRKLFFKELRNELREEENSKEKSEKRENFQNNIREVLEEAND